MIDPRACAECDEALKVLSLPPTAEISDIKHAHWDGAKIWHPDRFVGEPRLLARAQVELQAINAARDHLVCHWEVGRTTVPDQPDENLEAASRESGRDTKVEVKPSVDMCKVVFRSVWRVTTIVLVTLLATCVGSLLLLALIGKLMTYWTNERHPQAAYRNHPVLNWFSVLTGISRTAVSALILVASCLTLIVAMLFTSIWQQLEEHRSLSVVMSGIILAAALALAVHLEYRRERLAADTATCSGIGRYAHIYGAIVLVSFVGVSSYALHSEIWEPFQTPARAVDNQQPSRIVPDQPSIDKSSSEERTATSIREPAQTTSASAVSDTSASTLAAYQAGDLDHIHGQTTDLNAPVPPPTEEDRKAIVQTVKRWAEAQTLGDPESKAAFYAPRVDRYFLAKDVDQGFIAADLRAQSLKQPHLVSFDTFNFDITFDDAQKAEVSLLKVATRDDQTKLTVKSQLILKQLHGAWFITSERDFK